MESHHLRITAYERQALLEQYRKGVSTQVRLRAHILLLLAEGYSWAVIADVLFCSSRTIARWKSRVELVGVSAILRPPPPAGACLGSWWSAVVVRWVLEWTPQDFGFVRSRWCCKVICKSWNSICQTVWDQISTHGLKMITWHWASPSSPTPSACR